jgi:hypothetical protein
MASLAVLLVFVVAFFTALLGPIDRAVEEEFPGESGARRQHLRRLFRLGLLTGGFVAFAGGCLLMLIPLSVETVSTWEWLVEGRFPTDRGVLLLIDVSMAVLAIAGAWLLTRVVRRHRRLTRIANPHHAGEPGAEA